MMLDSFFCGWLSLQWNHPVWPGVSGQEEGEAGVKLGDFLANLVNPDRELIGGFSRVGGSCNHLTY